MLNTSSSYIQSQLSSVWPEWRITGTLGKGTYGDVYEILRDDLGISYKCALKVLTLESYESDPSLEEFVRNVSREIDMMMQLKGAPHIVTIEDYAVLRDKGVRTILIRMELLESVEKLSRKPGGLDKGEVLQLGIDICTALTSCELSNIIHRDIKLSNIFYSKKTGYKLGDFGISRTMDSIHEKISMSSAGTIQYLAPEVYYGYKYDNTVDIYSLGISLYILLNNNLPPFCNEYNLPPEQISMAMIHEANMRRLRGERFGAPANADERLASVICAACDPDSGNRFPSASQFLNALLACRDNRPVSLPGKTQSLNMTSQVLPSAGTEDNPTKMLFAESNPFQQGSYSQPAGSQRTGQDSLAGHSAAGIPGAAPPFSSSDKYTDYGEKDPSSPKRPVLLCILLALIAASLFCAILLMKRASSSSTVFNITGNVLVMKMADAAKLLRFSYYRIYGQRDNTAGYFKANVKPSRTNTNHVSCFRKDEQKRGFWNLIISDRTLALYGVKVGMTKKQAHDLLTKNKWKKISDEPDEVLYSLFAVFRLLLFNSTVTSAMLTPPIFEPPLCILL